MSTFEDSGRGKSTLRAAMEGTSCRTLKGGKSRSLGVAAAAAGLGDSSRSAGKGEDSTVLTSVEEGCEANDSDEQELSP
eukprot:CAMPEP_0116858370 /NCGR_PEP_ID=MMETSP0418-20121206/21134_1 /TAXON_ID=1158023 /ORGANISM="Astrosyne radiata, Strain 13vi08-1A" /LENGTH=78 /DNA_ID=CAMNT_0004492283 /DNA_START=35 /DNA_END=267 /DNA_ORIENTATION=-